MQIAKTNSVSSFGNIQIASYMHKNVITSAKAIQAEKLLKKWGLGKEKNIDIIIGSPFWHPKADIVATISSKKQGQPINPHAEMPIPKAKSKKKKDFIDWVKGWNYSYSKEGLEKFQSLTNALVEILSKNKPLG